VKVFRGYVTMTDHQAIQLMKAAGIVSARAPEHSASLVLTVQRGDARFEIPLRDFRSNLQRRVRVLEEERREILRNAFATPATTSFTLSGSDLLSMKALKRNDQLSKEERTDKTNRLLSVDANMRKERGLLLALAHLQIHTTDLLPKLQPVQMVPAPSPTPVRQDGREVWTRGVKAAALHCLNEARNSTDDDDTLRRICVSFLATYIIEDETDYTPERLFENVRQVRLLDRF